MIARDSIWDCFVRNVNGTGDIKNAFIHPKDIGPFVYCILLDPRTPNRYVFCYSQEYTKSEILTPALRISGKNIEFDRMGEEEVIAKIKSTHGVDNVLWG